MLEVENLSFRYGPITALHELSVTVEEGGAVAILGANGAGKTTLLSCIAGMALPAAGRVRFKGHDITRMDAALRVKLGVVLVPEGRGILGTLTVEENLWLGALNRRDRPEVRRQIDQAMERFPPLGRRRRQRAGLMSGGEQQMLALVRGVIARPQLLLIDEPSMGLAPIVVKEVFQLIAEIHAGGATVMIAEQNTREALRVARHAYVLQLGKVALSGAAADLARRPELKSAYLGEE